MARFDSYSPGRVTKLDGLWDFCWLGPVAPETVDGSALQYEEVQAVPGCFDASRTRAGARGVGVYRRLFSVCAADRHRLVFDAVNNWCRVVVDGEVVGDHSGGFSRFSIDLADLGAGSHELRVLVDNQDAPVRCPTHRDYYDWYPWGGISRSVTLHTLRGAWIDSVRVDTVAIDPPTARFVVALGGDVGATTLRIVCDAPARTEAIEIEAGMNRVEHTVVVTDAPLWSCDDPALVTFRVVLGADEVLVRTGLRTVETAGGRITINGEPMRLVGVGRHEFHPEFGAALPDAILADDVALLAELGVTFVRGAHYPQDERFLELCDQAGIFVWVEATGWQNNAQQLTDGHFLAISEQNIDEMIAVAANHPSVILWGLLNEGASHDAACRAGYERLVARIRANDPTRLVTYASNHAADDMMLDLVDVVSINEYAGWYYGTVDDIPAAFDRAIDAVEAAGHGTKPILFSEFGAEGIAGWRDRHHERWSEEHQARHLDTCLRHLLETRADRVAGAAVWVFADFRTSPAMPRVLGRPGSFNQKGVVDRRRGPKLATEVVRRWYRGID